MFHGPDVLPVVQPTVLKHGGEKVIYDLLNMTVTNDAIILRNRVRNSIHRLEAVKHAMQVSRRQRICIRYILNVDVCIKAVNFPFLFSVCSSILLFKTSFSSIFIVSRAVD